MDINQCQNETREESLERILTELTKQGGCGFQHVSYNNDNKWGLAPRDYDRALALDHEAFLDFIQRTQEKKYNALHIRAGDNFRMKIIESFVEAVKVHGLIFVIKQGFQVMGTTLYAMYSKPENEEDPDGSRMQLYESNLFYVARQFRYSKKDVNKAIDMVLLINGIPVVAIELKNRFTGQNSADAARQFCKDRDQNEPMFELNRRCIVMFAIDNYDVQMTTKLEGMDTRFFPFNQGSNGPGELGLGGNPVPLDDVPTHYMFDDILRKDNLMRLISDYVVYDDDDKKPRIIFPRYHQRDCVENMIQNVRNDGPGHSYLIEHSAGSGKSNTIAWLAFRLLYMQEKSKSVFDSVIICVHRTVLNVQLNETAALFGYIKDSVVFVKNSRELKDALINGKKVIVSTTQKFGMIHESLKPYKRNFAIIFDEAHTTSTGELNKKTKLALGVREITADEHDALSADYDTEEEIAKAYEKIRADGNQDNMSFFAFTATPTQKTLSVFGQKLADNHFEPHHTYSMMQAIDEGFILNVLEDYHTYSGYFDMVQNAASGKDPLVDKKKATATLMSLVDKDPRILSHIASIMVDYFVSNTLNDLGGNAKAMLVVDSREAVLRYRTAILEACKEKGITDLKVMVAFSGNLDFEGKKVTEADFNFLPSGQRVSSSAMVKAFDGQHFNFMIAADKFQVGFDQPKLTTMFVDKTLKSTEAVQTLSRLNRIIPGVEKHTHVLDFRNSDEDIRAAFEPYYGKTLTEEGCDPNYIYTKRTELEKYCVIVREEVQRFAEHFNVTDRDVLKRICGLLEPARQRYMILNDDDKEMFRKHARALDRQYRTVTTATNLMDPYFHDLVDFIHYLLMVLPKTPNDPMPDILDIVALDHFRLKDNGATSIQLGNGDPLSNPRNTLVAPKAGPEPLSDIVKKINDRWGLPDFNDADKLERLKAIARSAREEISKDHDLHDLASWDRSALKKQIGDKVSFAVMNQLLSSQEFNQKIIEDPSVLDDIVDSVIDDIKLHPDREFE